MNDTIKTFLEKYADHLDTRAIDVSSGARKKAVETLAPHLGAGKWLVCSDEQTWRVAGQELCNDLDHEGHDYATTSIPFHPQHEKFPMCDDERVAWFEQVIEETGATAGVAVGSGTINDVVKLACHRKEIPMACVATAPSMNGFTSGIAAVLSDGVKTTQPCKAPVAIVADLEILANSPARMIQSGLGDLISKPVSNSDWLLSAKLNGTFHSEEAMAIIEAGSAMLDGVAPNLPARDETAVGGLTGSLMLSGLAMSVAGSSSPASGGEHLISHYIDMTAHTFDLPYDFHGCQVGVGTLTTAHIYERLRAMDPSGIDVDALVAKHASWEDHSALLAERFGPLFDAVVKHAKPAYPTPERLHERLSALVSRWDEIMSAISQTLRTRQSIEDELTAADCPVRYKDLDIDRDRARNAIVHSKDIRNRYTILHLAAELGHLDEWADEALDLLYE